MSNPVSKMNKAQLVAEATRLGHERAESYTVAELRDIVENLRTHPIDDLQSNRIDPKPLSLDTLRKRRVKRLEGFPFILRHTTDDYGNPTSVRARIPDILDTETLNSLPSHLRKAMFDLVATVEEMEGKDKEEVESMSTADLVQNFGNISQMADGYVIAGFIEPRVYATAEEADENDGAWISDIHFNDRMAFFEYCSSREGGAARRLSPFLDGQDEAVGTGSDDTAVSGADQS